jgi:hypothetical protein
MARIVFKSSASFQLANRLKNASWKLALHYFFTASSFGEFSWA